MRTRFAHGMSMFATVTAGAVAALMVSSAAITKLLRLCLAEGLSLLDDVLDVVCCRVVSSEVMTVLLVVIDVCLRVVNHQWMHGWCIDVNLCRIG